MSKEAFLEVALPMSISRREIQLLQERVARLESRIYNLEAHLKAHDSALKPENLLRKVREGEALEKQRKQRQDLFVPPEVLDHPGDR